MSNDKTYTGDALANLGVTTPDMGALVSEYRRSSQDGFSAANIEIYDNVRYARWGGQSDDGKKHSENMDNGDAAQPFEGASDARCRLSDMVCNDLSDILTTAFARADLKCSGVELSDAPQATATTALLRYIRDGKMKTELLDEATYAAQWVNQYGWAAFFVGWQQEESEKMETVTMEEVMKNAAIAAQNNPDSVLGQLPDMIMNPEQDEETAEILKGGLDAMGIPEIKSFVKSLRETGSGEVKRKYISKNLPQVLALKPWEDICFPPETIDLQSARVIFRRCWMTQVDLESKISTDGWDKSWVEDTLSTMGKSSGLRYFNSQSVSSTAIYQSYERANLCEVIYAYTRTMDKGTPVITYTVFSANTTGNDSSFASHGILDYAHGSYPFAAIRREQLRRAIVDSRGVPEIVMTDQSEVKAQHDSIRDRTNFETLPPICVNKRIGQITKVGPFVHLPVTSPTDYQFMEPPRRDPSTAFNLISRVEKNVCNYFGLAHPELDPVTVDRKQQRAVNAWLSSWTSVFKQIVSLCYQYMPPEEIQRITGVAIDPQTIDPASDYDIIVKFDVRDMSTDFVSKKFEAITKFVMPMDRAGEIDNSKLVKFALDAIAPEMSQQLIMDKGAASEKLYRDVQGDVSMMMLGSQPLFVENDPTAKAKLDMLKDVVGKNEKAKQGFTQDQNFQQLMENYVKNLNMSIMQQENAMTGRYGVSNEPQSAGQAIGLGENQLQTGGQ